MDALEKLCDFARKPAQVAAAWRAENKRILGTRCIYVPEEIIWAAGMLPMPLYGTPEPVSSADSYFQSCTCEFIRNIFDRVLAGEMDYLDGLAITNTCDVVRHLYDIWGAYIKDKPIYLLNNPQKLMSEGNHDYYLEEIRRFRAWVEEVAGAPISDEKLHDAIALYNETRALLRALYDLRRQESPPISGQEALDVCLAVSLLPKDRANTLLRQLLSDLEGQQGPEASGPRLLITGSVIDHPALLQIVEDTGGTVVADDLCVTSRGFWHQVSQEGDPMEALYRYHNEHPLCACMHPLQARIDHVLAMVERFEVKGVINFVLKYCHPFLYEAPLLNKALEDRGVPVMLLEVGHDMSGHEQLRTRVQAFLEMVELEVTA